MNIEYPLEIAINGRQIGPTNYPYFIAEAGVNHNGDMNIAFEMINLAKDAGADAIKFQIFSPSDLILKNVKKVEYQISEKNYNENQYQMLDRLKTGIEKQKVIKEYCNKVNIEYLCTPFDEKSLYELSGININSLKIASTDTTNISFIMKAAKLNIPTFLSTGMTSMKEVEIAVNKFSSINRKLILMQCTGNYPTKPNDINLNVIKTYINKFKCIVGFSDHSAGVGATPYAITAGASVIEKHFTLDKKMDGPDHAASVDPDELRELVSLIKQAYEYRGSFDKVIQESEIETRKSLQKCLVANSKIPKGEIFSSDNLIAKRTGGLGISAINYDKLIGMNATKNYEKDDIIGENI